MPRWAGWAVGLALLVLALRILTNVRTVDLDVFHEMALFRATLALGSIPTEDLFAFTPTVSPSVHHEWGTGAVLYGVTVGLGLGAHGLVLLRLFLLGVVAGCCAAVARSRGATRLELSLAAPLAIVLFWPGLAPVRAHLFTFACLAILLVLLEKERRGERRWLLLWPLLFVAWINLHGGFVVGAGLLGLYSVEVFLRSAFANGRRRAWCRSRHLFLATASCIPLMLVNPYGLDYVQYLWHALLLPRPLIPEWAPLWVDPFRTGPLPLFAAALLVLVYSLVRGPGWRRLPGLSLVLVAAFFALRSVRILPIFALVWIAYLPPALALTPVSAVVRRWWRAHPRIIGAGALVLALAGLWQTAQRGPFSVELPTEGAPHEMFYPVGAAAYLKDVGFAGNLMTPFRAGAFVSWHLHPDVKVGMDSRYEVAYPSELVEENIRIYAGTGEWREFMDRYPTDAVLVPASEPLDSLMAQESRLAEARWIEMYRDDGFAVYGRPDVADRFPRVDRSGEAIVGRFP